MEFQKGEEGGGAGSAPAWGSRGRVRLALAPFLRQSSGEDSAVPSPGAGAAPRRLDLAYWLCLREGINAKRSPDLHAACVVLKKLNGRDKLTKAAQYFARALWWYYRTHRPDSPAGAKWETVFRATQSTRMCMYLFRTVEELDEFQEALRDKELPEWRRHVLAARAVVNMAYWYFDNVSWLAKIGFIDADAGKAGYKSDLFWAIDCAFGMALLAIDLRKHHLYRQSLESQLQTTQDTDEGALADDARERMARAGEKQFLMLTDLTRQFCDYLIGANGSPIQLPRQPLNDLQLGVIGFISALCALYKEYPLAPAPAPKMHTA